MKVLALNGSPRMKASSTYHMMKPFLEGMEAAGAETKVIHIRKLHLEPCIGCYTCWARTPGVCVHDDSMGKVLEKYNTADMVIFGTPLYHFTMSGIMKDFVDRLLPRLEPWLIPHPNVPGVTGHPERVHKPDKMFLISPCGFPEFEHFESLVATFKQIARMENWEYAGEILRPGAEPLSRRSLQGLFTHYYDLMRRAGEQVAREGRIADELQAELCQDLFPGGKQAFYDMAAGYWTEQMDRFQVPEEMRHTVPLLAEELDSTPFAPSDAKVESTVAHIEGHFYVSNAYMMQYLAGIYDPKAVPELEATIQIHLVPPKADFDPGPTEWYLNINSGHCTAQQGQTPRPTLRISTPHEIWQAIGSGEIDGMEAFENGRFEASGSMQLLSDFPRLFQYPKPGEGGEVNPELHAMMVGMPTAFNPQAAKGLDATIQYVLSGKGGSLYYVRIREGNCTAHRGVVDEPALTIHAPADIWLAISKGELDGSQAFMQGMYRVTGDMSILLKLDDLFVAGSRDSFSDELSIEEETMVDRSSLTCREIIAGMPGAFSVEAAGDMIADIQFCVSGKEPGNYYLHIESGVCAFHEGTSETPKLTIHTPSEIWVLVSNGEIDGQQAFMKGKYRVEGDFSLLMKLNDLFKAG
ncbi:MAG: hypothetical protein GY832_47170 [Chloroflexi bacterium]|nr:hypothetical protein [Chloroflexota bacterium]